MFNKFLMKRKVLSGLLTAIILLILSIAGIYVLLWQFPDMAMEYFGPAFIGKNQRNIFYYIHPFVISACLLWLWSRLRSLFKGSTFVRSLKFGLTYTAIATVPYMLLIYSAMDVSVLIILSWLLFGFLEATAAAIIFNLLYSK